MAEDQSESSVFIKLCIKTPLFFSIFFLKKIPDIANKSTFIYVLFKNLHDH